MKRPIHLRGPVNGEKFGPENPVMRCGRSQNLNSKKPVFTKNPNEVTCTSCRSYINNPWQVLRKYGRVKVLEGYYVSLWNEYGYGVDMLAYQRQDKTWKILMGSNGKITLETEVEAESMGDVGFRMVEIIETKLKKGK